MKLIESPSFLLALGAALAATTAAVVKALVWIVAAACGTTVLFSSLGY